MKVFQSMIRARLAIAVRRALHLPVRGMLKGKIQDLTLTLLTLLWKGKRQAPLAFVCTLIFFSEFVSAADWYLVEKCGNQSTSYVQNGERTEGDYKFTQSICTVCPSDYGKCAELCQMPSCPGVVPLGSMPEHGACPGEWALCAIGKTATYKWCSGSVVDGKCIPPSKNSGPPPSCNNTNPINGGTGNKYQSEVDYQGAGWMNAFTRYYNSQLSKDFNLGINWTTLAQRRLEIADQSILIRETSGRGETFTCPMSGSCQGDLDSKLRLLKETNDYVLTLVDGATEQYDLNGNLISITTLAGRSQTLIYSDGTTGPNGGYVLDVNGNPTTMALPAGLMVRLADASGRALTFGYDSSSRVVKMTDPAGQTYLYRYGGTEGLSEFLCKRGLGYS